MKSLPSSKHWASWGSRGTQPRNGTLACLASSSPPPLEKIFVHSKQCGQTKPLMFSTIPITRKPVFLQNVNSRLTSPIDTACGVVTKTAPRGMYWRRDSTVEMCSSEVPGGVSTMRKSSSPQVTSEINCFIKAFSQHAVKLKPTQ